MATTHCTHLAATPTHKPTQVAAKRVQFCRPTLKVIEKINLYLVIIKQINA